MNGSRSERKQDAIDDYPLDEDFAQDADIEAIARLLWDELEPGGRDRDAILDEQALELTELLTQDRRNN
jgi:hypothetical protein